MQNESNALFLLKNDHDSVKQLFAQIDTTDELKKKEVLEKLRSALEIHAVIEEEIFYPAVRQGRSGQVQDEVVDAYQQHHKIKELLGQFTNAASDKDSYADKVNALQKLVEHHIQEEEAGMFTDAEKYLGPDRLHSLGTALERRKRELVAELKGVIGPDSMRQ